MYYDELELRSDDERESQIKRDLPKLLAMAQKKVPAYARLLDGLEPGDIKSRSDLRYLPLLRKSEFGKAQSHKPPLGGLSVGKVADFDYVFQSPGPLYEVGSLKRDWWRIGRFLFGCGIGSRDIVQNCFSYHLTPAGHMFENGARAVGATVFPAGTGNTDLQVRAAADIGTTVYAGTPDYLKTILERAKELNVRLDRINKAAVSAGPLFTSLREWYHERLILCTQNYATAEAGNIAYETIPYQGMIVDEGVLVEIVTPGTAEPVDDGVIGEVVVTVFNDDYPLIRMATGDLSSILPGPSECGRTNMRISGWRGRADQTTKVKGLFVHPSQIAEFVSRHRRMTKARAIVTRAEESDVLTVKVEAEAVEEDHLQELLHSIINLRARIELVPPGSLPNDGKVIDDQRELQ